MNDRREGPLGRGMTVGWLVFGASLVISQIVAEADLEAYWAYLLGLLLILHSLRRGALLPVKAASVFCALAMALGLYFGYGLPPLESVPLRLARALLLGVYFCLLFSAVYRTELVCRIPRAERKPGAAQYLLLGLFLLALLAVFYRRFFPYGESSDTVNQWEQIHGLIPYNRVHAIGHTILLKAFLSLWDRYTGVVLAQLAAVAGLYLLFAARFAKKGIALGFIALTEGMCLLWTARSSTAYYYPWKDLPSALCLALMSFYFLVLAEDRTLRVYQGFALGLALSWAALFRLNGIIASLICGLCFLVLLWRRGLKKQLAAALLAIVLSVGGVRLYTDLVLKPADYENGFSIQVFGSGIAAAVKYDALTEEEEARIGALLSVDWMRERYVSPENKLFLIWTHDDCAEIRENPELELFCNKFVLDMGAHKKEVVRLYFSLLPRHFPTMLRDVLGSTEMVWAQDSSLFPCCHAFICLLLLILIMRFRPGGEELLIFLPALCNTLSIMISTVTNELRYLLPTFLLLPFFLLFFAEKAMRGKGTAEP